MKVEAAFVKPDRWEILLTQGGSRRDSNFNSNYSVGKWLFARCELIKVCRWI